MKKRVFLLFCLFLFFALFLSPLFSVRAGAEVSSDAETEASEELSENIDELLDSLDMAELEEYLEGLGVIADGTPLKDRLKELITGDYALDYDSVFSLFFSLFLEELQNFLPLFGVLLAVCLFAGIVNAVKGNFLSDSTSDVVHYVCFSCVIILVLTFLIPVIETCTDTVDALKTQMQLVFPLLITLMAASGGSVSAAIYQPAVAFLAGGITQIITDVVFPLAILIIALSMAGSVSAKVSLQGFNGLFKSVNKWLIGISVTLFSLFLTVQGIAGASYDGLSLRAVKYAIGNSVPMVGGFLSGGVDLVLAGSALIKNSLGAVAVLALVMTIARPLLLLIAFSLFLKLVSAVCEPIADARLSAFFGGLSADIGYFTAGLLAVAFLYFITLLLLICSSGVIF